LRRPLQRAGLWLASILLASRASALDPTTAITQYGLDTWGVQDGLPGSPITDIVQTKDGYVWVTTKGGLVRFDGVRFTVLDLSGVAGLKRKLMWSCAAGRAGELWAGAEATGVLRYKDGQASVLSAGPPWYGFVAIHEARDGGLWAANAAWGLIRFQGAVIDYRTKIDLVRTIAEGPDGAIWVGTWGSGIVRVKDGQTTTYGRAEGLEELLVSKLVWSKDGTLWVGTRGGLLRFRDGRFTRVALPNGDVKTLAEDRDHNLWIGTAGGLVRLRGSEVSVWRKADGMVDDQILALHEDDEGGLWIGGRGSLARIRDTNFKVYTTNEGLLADTVLQAAPARGGGVWVTTYGGGLSLLKDGRVTTYDTHKGLPNDYVGALHVSADGTVWMGVGSNELVRLHDDKITRIDTGKRYVKSLAEDETGLLLGLSRAGLHRLDNGKVVPYAVGNGAEAIDDKFIHTIHLGRDGTLWVGTNSGFAYVHEGQLRRFGESDGLSGADVYDVVEDPDGGLWLGTASGLEYFKDGRGRRFEGQPFLSDNSVFTVLEDRSGNFWFNSNDGIVRVSKSDLVAYLGGRLKQVTVHVFGSEEGLRLAESTLPTVQHGCRTPDGRLWFPTSLGLATVDPDALVTDHKVPPVFVEKVVIDGRAQPARNGLEIPAGSGNIEIHYTALTYTRPELASFRYRLAPFDNDWIDAGATRVAHYTKLPPGHYRFGVRAANADGVWNDPGFELQLAQLPRFHQTVWFRLLLALGAVMAVVGGHRVRVRQLEAREHELNRKVEDAVAQIKVLRGFLPICANCKKIRNDEGLFIQIESYLAAHSYAEFSHSICPDCMQKLYPGFVPRPGSGGGGGDLPGA
jgi:ligand-binding sensor domain-containing protein